MRIWEAVRYKEILENDLRSFFVEINELLKNYFFIIDNYKRTYADIIFGNYYIEWSPSNIKISLIKTKYRKKYIRVFEETKTEIAYRKRTFITKMCKDGEYYGDAGEGVIILNAIKAHILNKEYSLEENIKIAEYIKICMGFEI